MKKILITFCMGILVFTMLNTVNGGVRATETLRVGLLPDEDDTTVIKRNRPFQDYLEKALGKKVRLVVAADYSSMIEALRHGRLELAYFGPLSYVMAKQKSDIEACAARSKQGNATYQTVLIANRQAGINSIEEIRGKKMAFGNPASTSGHLIPESMLGEKGLHPKVDYKERFLGAHDAVAVAVQSGAADAGGLSRPIFISLVKRGIISLGKVKVLGYSKPFPQYPWSMRSDLSPVLKSKIRRAFHALS